MKYIILSFFIGLNVGIFACRYLSKPKEPKPIISLTQEQVQTYIAATDAQRELQTEGKGRVFEANEVAGGGGGHSYIGTGTVRVSCPQPQGGNGGSGKITPPECVPPGGISVTNDRN